MEEQYTKGEFKLRFEQIANSLSSMKEENITSHARLDANQKITNGNVAAIQKWKERSTGAAGVIIIVLIPLLTWALVQITNIPDKVKEGIQSELSHYEITVN